MAYHIDADNVSLGDLRRRIEETGLVPNRASLLDGIEMKFKHSNKGVSQNLLYNGTSLGALSV